MLVLSRKISQQIRIGSDICITVVKIDRNQVRLGISAPMGVSILREELLDGSSNLGGNVKSDHRAHLPGSAKSEWALCSANR